jgi:hypothetical protein
MGKWEAAARIASSRFPPPVPAGLAIMLLQIRVPRVSKPCNDIESRRTKKSRKRKIRKLAICKFWDKVVQACETPNVICIPVNRFLLSKAIGLIFETASEEYNLPWKLPEAVQEWLRGQKHTMFAFCPVNGIEDFRLALANCPGEDISISQIQKLGFKDLLLRLMLKQQDQLRAVPAGIYDDLMYTSLTG